MAAVDSSGDNSKNKVSFVKDIQLMMYGLGDCSKPLESTAALVELVVLDQLKRFMAQAEDIAEMREEKVIGPEDILFLMRRSEAALKRLITYLGIKDEKAMFCKKLSQLVDIGFKDQLTVEDEPEPIQWKKSRKSYCMDFLKSIGIEEYDLESIDDAVKESRQMRANSRTLQMSCNAYQEYHKARCASFSSAQMCSQKFLDWLRLGGMKQALTTPVAEMLVYLAKEAVANLIDMALTLREESNMFDGTPITTDEIHEVIRRCTYLQTEPMSGFSKDVRMTASTKVFLL